MSARTLRSTRSIARQQVEEDRHEGTSSFNGALIRFSYDRDETAQTIHNSAHSSQDTKQSGAAAERTRDRRVPQHLESTGPTSPSKRQRTSSKYVAPSRYAHLPLLNDVLAEDLLILFIGLNPGITTSQSGHAYAHPSNLFWKLLYSSGITDRRCSPDEDISMPKLYACGFTNIVGRPTKDQAELSKSEMVDGTPALEEKANKWRPEVCCLVGKGIWEAVYKHRHGHAQPRSSFQYGWQPEEENLGKDAHWTGSRIFVAASTSGASASLRPPEKEAIWKPLGLWIQRRRKERDSDRST